MPPAGTVDDEVMAEEQDDDEVMVEEDDQAWPGSCCGGVKWCKAGEGGTLDAADDQEASGEDEAAEEIWTEGALRAQDEVLEEGTKSWKAFLGLVFLVLFGAPSLVAAVLMAQDWMDPPLRLVAPGDARAIESVFAGGRPWLVSCVTPKSAAAPPPKVLVKVAERLRPDGVRVARVHCWEPLPGQGPPTTLAAKYGLWGRPPVVMVTGGQGPPRLLAATTLKAKALERGAADTKSAADLLKLRGSYRQASKPQCLLQRHPSSQVGHPHPHPSPYPTFLPNPHHCPIPTMDRQEAHALATDTMRMHSELFNQAKEALEVRCRKCTLRIRFGRHLDLTFWSLALRQVSSHLHQATFLWGRLCSRPWVLSTPGGTPGGPGCTCWGAVRGTAFLGGYAEAEKAHLQAEPAPRWP